MPQLFYRLDEQFDLFTRYDLVECNIGDLFFSADSQVRNLGYIVHPEIDQRLPPAAKIADVGTGTAVFLRRLCPVYASATLHGFDISPALFPSKSTLPNNIHLSVLDARQPVPDNLRGVYDLVHVRLLAAGLEAAEWGPVVQNLAQLLKPGGAMQWEECDFTNVQHYRGKPDSTVISARMVGRMFRDALRSRFLHGWDSLHEDMITAGLRAVQSDFVSSDRFPETRKAMTKNGMHAIFAWARLMTEKMSPGFLDAETLLELERQVELDIQSGCYVRFDIHVSWGFLPVAS